MLKRLKLEGESGSVIVTAVLVMAIMIPLGLALLSIVDTQARESGTERTRDRAFNLAESALRSAAFNLGRGAWPATAASAPSNSGPVGSSMYCGEASYGATLGAATNPGSATAKLQPNLNASYDDAAFTGATWQINVCDNDLGSAAPTVWSEELLNTSRNFDENADEHVWVRSEASVDGRRRVLAALVRVEQAAVFSSKYGLITGRMSAELTNTAGEPLSAELVAELVPELFGSDPLVAPDPSADTSPPTSGVIGLRCGALEGCLAGALGGLSSSAEPLSSAIGSGRIEQYTSPTATSEANGAQLKQQAISSSTYVASTSGSSSSSSPPACTIPAGANADTIVYIEQVGTKEEVEAEAAEGGSTGSTETEGGAGDRFCVVDVSSNVAFKALVIGRGRVVLRGDDTTAGGTVNTFRGVLYALNEQRATLGDDALPGREVVRLDRGARVLGGVAADGKSAQIGIYPPGLCTSVYVLGVDVGCALSELTSIVAVLHDYNPAIPSNVSTMLAVKSYSASRIVAGTYRDVAGELR